MFIDQISAVVPRRGGGLEKMVPGTDPAEAGGPAGGPAPTGRAAEIAGFARELGLESDEFAAELFAASAGCLALGRIAAAAAARVDHSVDPTSRSFADYVAAQAPPLDLGLSAEDLWVATVLSHLGAFTERTALFALASVPPPADLGSGPPDPEGVLMRLRMSGVVADAGTDGGRRLLRVPALLAASLRRSAAAADSGSETAGLLTHLVPALVDHLETAEAIDAQVLADVLDLARRARHWDVLVRLADSVGLPMFLLAPQAACAAYGGLPPEAMTVEPDLALMARIAEDIIDLLGGDFDQARLQEALIGETRTGRLRELCFLAVPDTAAPPQPQAIATEVGPGSVLRDMSALVAAGRHSEAADLGLSARIRPGAKRAQLTIRLVAAICAFHDGDVARARAILHDVEVQAAPRHVDGDYLVPAAVAWSALASAVAGDHERTDALLARLARTAPRPTLVDDVVRSPWRIATALRALDRLDLDLAADCLADVDRAPDGMGLRIWIPVIGRRLAVLAARTPADLIIANDDVAHDDLDDRAATLPRLSRDLVSGSRSAVFTALGQLRWAEVELEQMSPDSAARVVGSVRVELVAGRSESAIAQVEAWFYHPMLTPTGRAELAAIRAAAQARLGRDAEARDEFRTALGLTALVSSLLPLAWLPRTDRARLLDLSAGDPAWEPVFRAFADTGRAQLLTRLREVGAVSVSEVSMPQLSKAEAHLLDLLATDRSIAQISAELHQVPGTVKNRLSALYRKFGVSGRAEAITRAGALGFLPP
ncbi:MULTISPECIES: helix-turn-helix transcriptional regulator [Brevibacterium]|uniref:HTH luxR-type domain-containing protein n=1 Tax=Brevibacterium casei TaxID=33889 RepID=A0A7T4A041_9MICO|nr:helix-turn-helix transcriptional regulator [Brevibacterium casei]QQB14785.1 hypothetical protein I6H47_02050 [Brevibacterium casei]